MASSAPSSPRRRVGSEDIIAAGRAVASEGRRSRLPSAEYNSSIPRTYSGLYGEGAPIDGDGYDSGSVGGHSELRSPPRVHSTMTNQSNLLPFELSRNPNTDWITNGGPTLLVTYISILAVITFTFLAFVNAKVAWTLANASHAMVSLCYLHWIKGNPADYFDGTQGEMNYMTLWEQIVSKPSIHLHAKPTASPPRSLEGSLTRAIKKLRSRDVLCVIPTLLAQLSCHAAKYQTEYVVINVGVWSVVMIPKLPFMNGVRLFGINRTAGIDDCLDIDNEDDCFETEEESEPAVVNKAKKDR